MLVGNLLQRSVYPGFPLSLNGRCDAHYSYESPKLKQCFVQIVAFIGLPYWVGRGLGYEICITTCLQWRT